MFKDNFGTIGWTEIIQGLREVKKFVAKYHYVRSKVDENVLRVVFAPSEENKVDLFPKILGTNLHAKHRAYGHVSQLPNFEQKPKGCFIS